MTELFPEKIVYPPPNKDVDFYILVAYWAPGELWKLFPTRYSKEEVDHISKTLPKGYTERRIYHIR